MRLGLGLGLGGSTAPIVPSFAPSDVSGLALWLDGGKGVTANGSTASAWADQSGNSRNATQASAPAQPVIVASAINGKPGLSADGARQMSLPDLSAMANTGGNIFFVLKNSVGTGHDAVQNQNPFQLSTEAVGDYYPFSDGNIYNSGVLTTRQATAVPGGVDMTLGHIVEFACSTTEYTVRFNGTQASTSAGPFTVGYSAAPTIFNGNTGGYNGTICEVIVYGHVLSSGDRASVVAYLKTKYGIA